MSMSESGEYNLLDQLAEEFAERFRRGERPSLEEYAERYPELAEEIRDLFPAMVKVERAEGNRQGKDPNAYSPSTNPPMSEIGDYRILREIGRGGMGVVYEAEQISLGRRVALKVLPRQASGDPMVRERFRREARAAAKLHHTNIVPVYEVGQDGDVRFYAMQFIQGQGLDQVINELRRLRDRSGPDPGIRSFLEGRPLPPSGEHSRPAPDAPIPGEEAEVSGVLRSILAGRFDPDSRPAEPVEASRSRPASSPVRNLTTLPGSGMEPDAARSGPVLKRTEVDSAIAGDTNSPGRAHSPPSNLSSSGLLIVKLGDPARGHPALVGRDGSARLLPQPGADRPAGRRRAHLRPRAAGSCTATSSRRTCSWTPKAWSGSRISAWPRGTTKD